MPWDVPLFTSLAMLMILQGSKIHGMNQETGYVIECIRDMIPMQVFNDCCMRENNCSVTRQQNKGIDCMSRMLMSNYSSPFTNSHNNGSPTTEMSYQYNSNSNSNNNNNNNHNYNGRNQQRWYGDFLDTLSEICRRQPKGKIQTCIRNELIKRCRYSMLQERITSPPGRWNQRQGDTYHGGDQYGSRNPMDPQRGYPQYYGNRRNQDSSGYQSQPSDYGDSSRHYSRGNYNNEDMDEEDFGYSDGDSMRYK